MRHWRMISYPYYAGRLKWRDMFTLAFFPAMRKQRFVWDDQYKFGAVRGGDIDG